MKIVGLERLTLLGLLALGVLGARSANAQLVHPSLLLNSNDGTSLQQAINNDPDLNASVGAYDAVNDVPTYGDQVTGRLFERASNAPAGTRIEFQFAGFAAAHRIGWYRPGDPNNITWFMGGSNTGLGSSANLDITGIFGLVMDSGNNGANNGTGGNTRGNNYFYSQLDLNSDTAATSSIASLNGFDRRNHVAVMRNIGAPNPSLILGWEDLKNEPITGMLNYNDLGMQIKNVQAVPEPGTMVALGLGALALLRRRKAKASQ